MKVRPHTPYRIIVRFPWGARRELVTERLTREADGTLRWDHPEHLGVEPYLDCILEENEQWVRGWVGGCCDVTAVIGCGVDLPEP